MTVSKFLHVLLFGTITTAQYIADDFISGNLSDLSLLIYQKDDNYFIDICDY